MIPLVAEDPLEPPQGPLRVPGPHFENHCSRGVKYLMCNNNNNHNKREKKENIVKMEKYIYE